MDSDCAELKIKFTEAMSSLYDRTVAETKAKYKPTEFRRMVAELGGRDAVRSLLAKPHPSQGFTRLIMDFDLPHLTVEYHVLRPEWHKLFLDSERVKALLWLTEAKRLRADELY